MGDSMIQVESYCPSCYNWIILGNYKDGVFLVFTQCERCKTLLRFKIVNFDVRKVSIDYN